MGDAGGSQTHRGPLDASQYAPRPTQTHREDDTTRKENGPTEWHSLIDTLQTTESDLMKEEETPGRAATLAGVRKAIRQTRALWTQASRGGNAAESRLIRIEDKLEKLIKKETQRGNTWAQIAQSKLPAIRRPPAAITTQRTTVRIRLDGAQEKTPKKILTKAKKSIPGAYMIRQLRSGDIDIMVPSQAVKDRILNQLKIEGIKVLRQDYLIKVLYVLLNVRITSRKNTDNVQLIQEMYRNSKGIIPNLAINQIQ